MTLRNRIGLLGLACWLAASVYAQQTIYVNGTTGNDAWTGLCEVWDGGTCGPKKTIQAGIEAAVNGDTVLVADGTYTDTGNKNIDFHGKAITVRAANGPEACIIDCQNSGRGLYFHSAESAASIVRGLTIREGNATDGGGIFCQGSSPTLANCVITGNSVTQHGGGIYCSAGSPTLADCTIAENSATGAYPAYGGGVYCENGANPTLTDCTIVGNWADGTRSSWSEANSRGGGVCCYASGPTFTRCTIAENSVLGDWVAGGLAMGGAVFSSGSSPTFTDCTIAENSALADYDAEAGALYCIASTATLANCTITGNSAHAEYAFGGALLCYCDINTTLTNCALTGNWAFSESGNQGSGGAIYSRMCNSPTLASCVIIGNWTGSSGHGAILCADYGSPALSNCTVAWNTVGEGAISCYFHGSNPRITNCILWSDTPAEVYSYGGAPLITYCDVQGGWPGAGNIDADPLFADPNDADYHLSANSPCIDAGDPAFVPAAGETDLDGQLRVWDGDADGVAIVDMGADEYASHRVGDLNCDGAVDFADINPFVLFLSDFGGWQATFPGCDPRIGDINGDGTYGEGSFGDINPFVALITHL
jgi:predicted outer membrane repeat protein